MDRANWPLGFKNMVRNKKMVTVSDDENSENKIKTKEENLLTD